jgi:quercetin dioxygenase-like cupin family protein
MNERELTKQLEREGFRHTYVWQDASNAYYPEHTHTTETAHVILQGKMTLSIEGQTRSYGIGERCDVPAGTSHSARIGPDGCRYSIGER